MSSERLIELINNDDIKMARILAKGIRQSDNIIDIQEMNNSVRIELDNFIGFHDVRIVDNDEKMIKQKGRYKLKSDEVDFKFTCSNIQNQKLKQIYKYINNSVDKEDDKENDKENDKIVDNGSKKFKLVNQLLNLI